MNYELGLDTLREYAKNSEWYPDFSVQEQRLRENLRDERRYGTDETLRNTRTRIIDRLNELAMAELGISFNDLCLNRVPMQHPRSTSNSTQ